MAASTSNPIRVLLLTKTCGYRHDCIPALVSAFTSFPFEVKATENSCELLSLSRFDVIALGHTTGNFLTQEETDSLLAFVENGGGVVGIHAASSGMSTDAKYTKILGEVFNGHPPPEWTTLAIENSDHYINRYESLPAPDSAPDSAPVCPVETKTLPASHFPWFDEVYTFKSHPRLAEGRTILLSVQKDDGDKSDESAGFPLSWTQMVGKGRVYYTALGHFDEAYRDSWFKGTLHRAIVWAAKKE
ncbi:glycosyl hydrolase [Fusarium beomiforme]|uniref:Glycosyl hydrolase n=1 Tax=Fusarium beomiforme TaxID=44412 RepID=A0A9P5AD35_9HYPO|nr:glycosyl hydrolase [Fusarium beomiforme]